MVNTKDKPDRKINNDGYSGPPKQVTPPQPAAPSQPVKQDQPKPKK